MMNFGTEIFCKTLCKFTERKVRSSSEGERIMLQGSTMETKDLYKSIQAKLHKPDCILHKIYKYVICKKAFLFLVPVGLFLLFLSQVFHGNWMNLDSAYYLMEVIFYSYLIIINPFNDWVYIWRLKLYLWFREIPQHFDGMVSPRCITMHWDTHRIPKGQEQQWMIRKVIEKTGNELGIYDFEELKSTLQAIQASSPSKRSVIFKFIIERCFYFLFFLSALGIFCYKFPHTTPIVVSGLFFLVVLYPLEHALVRFLKKSRIWLLFLFVVPAIPLLSIVLYNYTMDMLILIFLFIIAALYLKFPVIKRYSSQHMSCPLNNNKFSEEEIEKCFETIDVVFRVHKALKNESICFTVVTDDFSVLTQIPAEYQRYFKFIIVAKSNLLFPEIYDHSFDLSEISQVEHPPVPILPTAEINLTNWVEASLRCVNENTSQFVANGLRFLSLLIEINNGVLSNYVILSVVRPQLTKLASNFRGEMSLQNQGDFNHVKELIGYSEKIGIIRTSQE